MAIVFVGGVEGSATNGGNVTLDLTALTGGAESAAAAGDVVIVLGAMSSTQTVTIPAAYISLVNATSTKVGWKQMGATPDTSVTVTGSGSGTNATAGIAFVYRGVDLGSITAATTTGTSTNPDPPSIVTVTPNAVVVAGFRTAILDTSVTAPTSYAHQFDVAGDDNNDVTVGMSDRTIASPTTEDPAAWTGVSSAAWQSFSVRLHEAKPFDYDVELPDAFHIIRAAKPFDPPNLQAVTLAPPPEPPFFGLVLEAQGIPKNLPEASAFDPPNLTIGTLSLSIPLLRGPVVSRIAALRSALLSEVPNLLGTTLAPAAPAGDPFRGYTADRASTRAREAKPLDPPNLQATTLAPAPAGDPFRGYTADRANTRARQTRVFEPPDLSLTTLAPPPGPAPFFGSANPLASRIVRAVQLISPDRVAGAAPAAPGTPFFGYTADRAGVRNRAVKGFDPPNNARSPSNFLVTVFGGASDKLRPAVSEHPPNTLITALTEAPPQAPFSVTDWPTPKLARAIAGAPHFEPSLLATLFTPQPKPFLNDDWPLPYPRRFAAKPYDFTLNPLLFEGATSVSLTQTLEELTLNATLRKANWIPQSGNPDDWTPQSGSGGSWTPQSGSSGSWTPQ